MNVGDILLLAALVATIGHVIMDVLLGIRHAVHPRDTALTVISVTFLVSHVILTGEAMNWLEAIPRGG